MDEMQVTERTERWQRLLRECTPDLLDDVRVRLLLWRSGTGVNSLIVEVDPFREGIPGDPLRTALWRMNPDFDAIMSIELARVNVPAPVPPSLGFTIHPGIDTAGLYFWDGFFDTKNDTWNGLLSSAILRRSDMARMDQTEPEPLTQGRSDPSDLGGYLIVRSDAVAEALLRLLALTGNPMVTTLAADKVAVLASEAYDVIRRLQQQLGER